mgnify:CR=1 FL=1|jgi:putative FmdB family regulatory protein
MPIYCYSCSKCQHKFEIKHSMNFDEQLCIKCGSKEVFKIPSLSVYKSNFKKNKPGKIVDEYIENTKMDIKKEKENIKKETL